MQRREAAEDIPVRVQNKRQCVRVSVASPVKVSRAKIVAASSAQKHKMLPAKKKSRTWGLWLTWKIKSHVLNLRKVFERFDLPIGRPRKISDALAQLVLAGRPIRINRTLERWRKFRGP
jgi:hypothetical protein